MDAKNIFISSETYIRHIDWESEFSDTEWRYIGNNVQRAFSLISDYFQNDRLYLVKDRHNSSETTLEEIQKVLNESLEKESFVIWNITFGQVIEFNRIGIFRMGKRI